MQNIGEIMKDLKKIYGIKIYERGLDYYENGHVLCVLKIGNKLYGEVLGSGVYEVEVDLENLNSKCSCPYGINCKHGVAVILGYKNGNYVDVN